MADDGDNVMLVFEVWSPPPPSDFRIIVTGGKTQLGNWFTERPVSMELQGEGVWRFQAIFSAEDEFEYKYACYSNKEGRCVGYEQGPNRFISVAKRLASEGGKVDSETGMRMVCVKDVWSAVQQRQKQKPAEGNSATHSGYASAGPMVPMGNVRPMAESAAKYLHQQIMHENRASSGSAGSANGDDSIKASAVDTALNNRLSKVVGEVSGLKKKLKESQRDQVAMMKNNHETEMRYQQRIKELEDEIKQLHDDSDRLQQEMTQTEARHAGSRSADEFRQLEAQLSTANSKLREAIRSQEHAQREAESRENSLRGEMEDLSDQLKAKTTELSILSTVVEEFAKDVEDDAARESFTDPDLAMQDRLGNLLLYLEEQANKMKASQFSPLFAACKAMRQDLVEINQRIEEDVATEVQQALEIVRVELGEFMKGQEKEKTVFIERYHKQYLDRKRLANEVVDLKGKIRVFGRARPFIQRELELGHVNVLAFPEANRLLIGLNAEKYLMVNDVALGADTAMGENKIEDVKTYELDHIFGPQATQEEVFEEVRHLVGSVMDGYNVTLFAYGQTGSGKTHTMDGTPENPGLTYRSLGLFFDPDAANDIGNDKAGHGHHKRKVLRPHVQVSVSMLEIYNEEIRDLLNPDGDGTKTKLDVRQTQDGGSHVPGLVRIEAPTLEDALRIMGVGRDNRKTAETKMNAHSSRSHMVFTAHITVTNPVTKDQTTSKLNLVDLAGSERVSKSKATGEQLKEALAINKSLLALGDVVAALTARTDKSSFVPYRNSKLTFLLQDSLCGNARTAMFVNFSPSSDNYWETISTLNFGCKAASVELGQVQKNFQSGEIMQLRDQVLRLQAQLSQEKGSRGDTTQELTELRQQTQQATKELDLRDKRIKLLTKQLEEATAQLTQAKSSVDAKNDRTRADIKEKDDRIKDLEEALKKSKREAAGRASADTESSQKEVSSLRKQLQETTKQLQLMEARVLAAENRAKKVEKAAARDDGPPTSARGLALPRATDRSGARSPRSLTPVRGESPANIPDDDDASSTNDQQ